MVDQVVAAVKHSQLAAAINHRSVPAKATTVAPLMVVVVDLLLQVLGV
jgi:hypothetical protein